MTGRPNKPHNIDKYLKLLENFQRVWKSKEEGYLTEIARLKSELWARENEIRFLKAELEKSKGG